MPNSNAFRNLELFNRSQALKEHGDYGLVGYSSWYQKPGQQQISTGYANLNGSVRTYTPKYSDSTIVYMHNFQIGYRDAHDIAHFRIYHNGSHWTGCDSTYSCQSYGDDRFTMMARLGSWGAGVSRETKVMVREYGGSNEAHMNATGYWDGGGGDRSSGCFGHFMEWREPPAGVLDFGA